MRNRRIISFNLVVMLLLGFIITFNVVSVKGVTQKKPPKSKTAIKKVLKNDNTYTLIISSGIKGCLSGKGKTLLKKILKVANKKDALALLKENSEVIENGGFITYINGFKSMYPVPNSKMTAELKSKGAMGADWFVYLNNKKTLIGAGQIYPKKGDVIMFDYHYWNKDEFNSNNN